MHTNFNTLTYNIVNILKKNIFISDEDCYKLVEAQTLITSTSKNKKHVPSDETTNG